MYFHNADDWNFSWVHPELYHHTHHHHKSKGNLAVNRRHPYLVWSRKLLDFVFICAMLSKNRLCNHSILKQLLGVDLPSKCIAGEVLTNGYHSAS